MDKFYYSLTRPTQQELSLFNNVFGRRRFLKKCTVGNKWNASTNINLPK